MKFSHPAADIYLPDTSVTPAAALARTTHLCVAAHQDDIEIMAYHGIAECFGQTDKWFSGVVVTNGAGSPRSGIYGKYTDEQMQTVRFQEQRKAALVGEYSIQLQLAHPSSAVKDRGNTAVHSDLLAIFTAANAEVVYLHQPADKHDTHIGVLAHSLAALRQLPAERRPKRVLGCEVWRDLDWMIDSDKQVLDAGRFPNLAMALVGVAVGAEFFAQGVGGGEVGDGIRGEEGREAVLPVLMAALDLAFGLRGGGVAKAHAVKVEGFAELGERTGEVGEEEGMVVDVEGEREAVGEEGGRQEVKVSEEIFAFVKTRADAQTAAIIEHVEQREEVRVVGKEAVRSGIELPESSGAR